MKTETPIADDLATIANNLFDLAKQPTPPVILIKGYARQIQRLALECVTLELKMNRLNEQTPKTT